MPQMNKGGKFIFGKSLVREDGFILFPPQAVQEYQIAREGRVILFTGSKSTGGFCATRRGLLEPSKLGNILTDTPDLRDCRIPEGAFLPYKGRAYCWVEISPEGMVRLGPEALAFLRLRPGMELLSIRSSDIAFTMGAEGPLLERARRYPGAIHLF